jgi:hypothetical protein
MTTANFARPESQLAFASDEQLAYECANEVRELDLEQFKGIAISYLKICNNLHHINNPERWFTSHDKFMVVDRRKLGGNPHRRFQIIKLNHNQDIVAMCRTMAEVYEAWHNLHNQ